ncbi:hypothetical protein NliqN6_2939 [Naganishia liquefaciens]|uniref:Telomere-associated protein Rif1 N-terminal domain-containing protein n=1 Tax=Naganishia liquefaciens TaxID=104408 RepID=A0A8H3TST9_9TREE|nr:hypothetical protein NliqN6_2939 [Naganishia liquefaciens]
MTIHPTPRRAPATETLDDVFTAIIPPSSSDLEVFQKKGQGKMDPLQRRLSMMTGRKRDLVGVIRASRADGMRKLDVVNRTEKMDEENTVPGVARTPKVSFSPYNRHHPYNPAMRVSSSLKQSTTVNAGEASPGTPLRTIKSGQQGEDKIMRSGLLVDVVGSTPSQSGDVPQTSTITPLTTAPTRPVSIVKSILKRHHSATPIRIAENVEQGTRENTEESRTRLGSPRPGLVKMDSFALAAKARSAAGASVGDDRKGGEEAPGSDGTVPEGGDDTAEKENQETGSGTGDDSSGQRPGSGETSRREIGSNSVDSLLDIIIHEADDLLAVEDAYSLLQVRYRSLFAAIAATPTNNKVELDSALESFRTRSSDIFRAFLRDITRLVETPITSIPPPLLDSSPPPTGHLDPTVVTPSPSPDGNHRLANFTRRGKQPTISAHAPISPVLGTVRSNGPTSPKPTRQGYSEAEVRWRRALAGVGQASLRFLAFVLHRAELHRCMSDTDVTELIRTVLMIPTTPKLYTPNPKKSYALAMYSLCHLQVPIACINPIKEKFMQVITYGLGDGGIKCWGTGLSKQKTEGGNVKARLECFAAMANAHVQYPSLFIPRHKEYLPLIFKALIDGQAGMKARAGMALCAFVKGRLNWLRETDKAIKDCQATDTAEDGEKVRSKAAVEAWMKARKVAQESQISAQDYLTTTVKQTRADAERIAVWDAIVVLLTKAMTTDPLWACTIWTCIVSLLGQTYLRDHKRYRQMNAVVLSILANQDEQESQAGRTTLCCLAWNHTIHALFNHRAREYIDETSNMPRRYYDVDYTVNGEKTMNAILSLPAEAREKQIAESANVATLVTDDAGKLEWVRSDTPANQIWLASCANSLTPIVYAYTGAILRATPPPPGQGKQGESATDPAVQAQRISTIFDRLLLEYLPTMMAVKALDTIKVEGWKILRAVVDNSSRDRLASWSMNRLVCESFFRNDGQNKEIAGVYRDRPCLDAAIEMVTSGIQAESIPAWGTEHVCANFVGGFGRLFVEAVKGLSGILRLKDTGEWVGRTKALPLLPKYLFQVWESLLAHVSRQTTDNHAHQYLAEITRILVDLYRSDVASYTPLSITQDTAYDPEVRRSEMCLYLSETANRILLDNAFSQTRLTLNSTIDALDKIPAPNVMSADSSGNPTSAGYLLHHVTSSLANATEISKAGIKSYLDLFSSLLAMTLAGSGGKRTLGQITYAFTTPTDGMLVPEITRGIWSILCESWCSTLRRHANNSGSGSGHTLDLLVSLLCLPFKTRVDHSAIWSEGWTRSWHTLFATAYARSEARQLSYFASIVEPICQSILANEFSRASIIVDDDVWSCFEALTFKMDTVSADNGAGPLSFFALVDQLASRHSAEINKVSQLVSAALACTDFCNVGSETVQRLWIAALSAHHSPLSNEAETLFTKLICTELKGTSAGLTEVLRSVSPIFCTLLSSPSVQDRNSFRTLWNGTFGKVEVSEQEISQDLLPLLLERWEDDNTTFDMPIWLKAKEESQAGRAAITTIHYEADISNHFGECQSTPDDQNSQSRRVRTSRHPDNPPAISSSSNSEIPPTSSTPATTQNNVVAKGRTAAKRMGKKSRKRSRAPEPKEGEVSGPVRQVALQLESRGLGEVPDVRASKRRKVQPAGDQVVSTRSQAKQDSSITSSKRSSRKTDADRSISAIRQETPAQEADAMEEIEEALSAPDEPEDRVEVVIESQERRSKAITNHPVDRNSGAKKAAVLSEDRSSVRAKATPMSPAAESSVASPEPVRKGLSRRDVLTLIEEAASMKSTISRLEISEINRLMAMLEELRSSSVTALKEKLSK